MKPKIIIAKGTGKGIIAKFNFIFLIGILSLSIILSATTVARIKKGEFALAPHDSKNEKNKTIIIDAGHGGFDGGAVVGDIFEKDINLKISNYLVEFLRLSGFNVITTRIDDSSTESNPDATISARKKSDLKNRLLLAKNSLNAIMVSVHLNKFSLNSCKGAQVFYSPKGDESKKLAESIKNQIKSTLQPENHRTVKKGTSSTYLLYYSPIPTVIAECGFMSNPEEFIKLQDDGYQKQMAFAIYCGILDYYNQS